MAEILGLGMSHYPGFIYADEDMVMRVKETVKSNRVPAEFKTPDSWPAPMRAEWGEDEGLSFAARHRAEFFAAARELRAAVDDFKPEVVIIFGDDQYENFREDIVPPFCIYISGSFDTKPFLHSRGRSDPPPNVWGEPSDKLFAIPGHADAGRYLTKNLLGAGFDMPYAYKWLHHEGLGHAFIRVPMYLDYDRRGWDYPIVPIHVNAYGSNLVRGRGGTHHLDEDGSQTLDPPAPSPRRCFELGEAVARIMRDSPWRTAIVGSSSWSHAFLTEKNHWLYPDVISDRKRFEELKAGNFTAWRDLTVEDIEDAGQHELLNWVPMVGAMHALGQQPSFCQFIETYLMNSCKCMAVFPPVPSPLAAGSTHADSLYTH